MKKKNITRAAMIGTALEYYDISIYGFMAPLLINIFLPTMHKVNALILTFIFPIISIIVRPLGALMIGKIGDKYGRRVGLIISIGGMTIATGLIGLLPTYTSIGIASPIMFIILRSLQGFFIAGEYNGGAILVLEHTQNQSKGYASGMYSLYTVFGIAVSAIVCTSTSYLPKEFWRIPFAIGCITGIVGIYLRKHVQESPQFIDNKHLDDIPIKQLVKKYKKIFAVILISSLFSALYTLPTILMNSLLPMVTSYTVSTIMLLNTVTTILYMATFPLFGYISDKISYHKSISTGALLILLLSYPLISVISLDNLVYIFIVKMCFALLTSWIGAPFHAWVQSLFQVRERYAAISFGHAVGSQIGSLMVPLSLWTWKNTGSMFSIYTILMTLSASVLVILYYQKRTLKLQNEIPNVLSRSYTTT